MKNKAIKITPIEQHQIDEAKQVVIKVSLEIWDELSSEDDLKRFANQQKTQISYQKYSVRILPSGIVICPKLTSAKEYSLKQALVRFKNSNSD